MYEFDERDDNDAQPPIFRDQQMLYNLFYYSFCRLHEYARALLILDRIEADQLLYEDQWGKPLGN